MAGGGVTHHVVFHLMGRPATSPPPAGAAITPREVPTRLRAVAEALCDLGQRVSFVDDRTGEIACDVLVVVPVAMTGTGGWPRAPIAARWKILWVDRAEPVTGLDPRDFDCVYVTWAELRRHVLARSGLASDRVLTTGLGVSSRGTPIAPARSERDPYRVALLAGSEPARALAAEILRGLRELDSRFSVEILGGPDVEDELDNAVAQTSVLVVTGPVADDQADLVIRAKKAGAVVVAADGGAAAEVILPDYDGVLLEEAPDSPAFAKACVAQILRLRDDRELAERLRARAMTEPLSWHAIARQWVAHWRRLAAPADATPPRVSVVMGVWNEARYVEEAIDSILGQTVWDLELIVVNDGSTDETAEILRRYRDGRLRVIDQANTGLWAALNRGLREVRGGLVARMDGDDITHPRRLQYQLDFLETHPDVAVVGTACYKIDAAGRIFMLYPEPTDDRAIKRRLADANPFIHPSVLIRREALDRVGGYRCYEAEDYDLFLRISERFGTANLESPLHRVRRTGTTRVARFEREILDSVRRSKEEARQRCAEAGLFADLRWRERRPYARTLHALGEATVATDRARALFFLARAAVLAPEIAQHWRSWLRVWLARRRPAIG